MKKLKNVLILAFISIAGSGTLNSCTSDEIPEGGDYCNTHLTLNNDYINNLLFDYENTDTLLYKRTINNVLKDTILFVKQKSFWKRKVFF